MNIHLVDGTFELFRAFFGAPAATSANGREVGATRGFMRILRGLLREPGVTHVACAFDHVIESFRNQLFDGYKTGDGIAPALLGQFELVERAAAAMGVVVWPMVEFEADDALATAAHRFADAPGVEQVQICSPDKDLAQCIRGTRVVGVDRMRKTTIDEAGVVAKFGVSPGSIPDWLALVGDTADGIPGVPRWGAKSAAQILARWRRLEDIPDDPSRWEIPLRGADALAASLRERRQDALLYRRLATLRTDVPLTESLPDLAWRGARRTELTALCEEVGDRTFLDGITRWA